MSATTIEKNKNATKLLGCQIPEELYWQFKNVATQRKEEMREAIINAALLYIEARENMEE